MIIRVSVQCQDFYANALHNIWSKYFHYNARAIFRRADSIREHQDETTFPFLLAALPGPDLQRYSKSYVRVSICTEGAHDTGDA